MATEEQANKARDKHSDLLRNLGAHSIGVDEINHKGKKTFAVVAYMEQKPDNFPSELEIANGKDNFNVPLIAKISETFKPE